LATGPMEVAMEPERRVRARMEDEKYMMLPSDAGSWRDRGRKS
jgi:hypothetical protein